ncbi:Site-specific recombinase XerD [Salegentibacter echinorum]|uniref:Site-specific recombinase XerD n=1 Tax=Salegentibacter echinorum TaxID=1073325 RepID=A0A1M5FVB7_SALEC|nr:site-specific integrase [Salegentibacter echinorum]SHF95142.1 Site-specific recombinase XerD [Salegentibacter echinorum]
MSVKLREKKIKNGKSFYLDIHQKGKKRTYKFLGIKVITKGPKKDSPNKRKEKIRIAEERAAQEQINLISKGTSYTPDHLREISFEDFSNDFLKNYRKRDHRMITSAVKKFKEMINYRNLHVSDITPELMEQYMEFLLSSDKLSGETPHNYFTRFKKMLKAAKIKGLISEMPTADIVFKNPNKEDNLKKEILEIDELRILSKTRCGNPDVKRAFLFCCYTGLGLAEVNDLKWSEIKKGRLVTRRKKTGSAINNQLSTAAVRLLGEPGKKDENVFQVNKISYNAVNKNLKYWLKRADIDKNITFYCARHSFACLLLMNGANLKSVADAMGHASTKTTLKYLNHVERLKDEAVSNLPDIEI